VASQSYKKCEHVIVDGGSVDGTCEFLGKVSLNLGVYVSEPDAGIYDAINKGINLSRGEIIGVLNSDDFYPDSRVLEFVADSFMDANVDLVYGDLDYIRPENEGKIIRRWRPGVFSPNKLKHGWMPPHPTVFIRRRIYEEYGFYSLLYKISSDYDFLMRILQHENLRASYIPRVMIKMRLGGVSNRSLKSIFLKSKEDYMVIKSNKIGGFYTLVAKNISKITQFF
jgi:glycosyltransferase